MKVEYGKTFWGKEWLNALTNIDYDNRLDRGRRYANNGSVEKIDIENNAINAKVSGSRPKPYSVTVISRPFTDDEKKIILDALKENTYLIPQLLNRQLPKELLDIIERKNINIFPKSWQDLKLNCSCPDWAVPCKHLAAVIYKIANEIDQNPFMAFSLRQLNLIQELKNNHIEIGEFAEEKIYSINNAIDTEKKEKADNLIPKKITPDFSQINNLLHQLPLLYTAAPLFYESDFKKIIQNKYHIFSDREANYLAELKSQKLNFPEEWRYIQWHINYKTDGSFSISNEQKHTIQPNDFSLFLAFIAQSESKKLDSYSDSFAYLYRLLRFCNFIIEKGAVLPRLFDATKDNYRIQWIPALINDSVKVVFENLLSHFPQNIISHSTFKGKKEIDSPLINAEAQLLLCSIFLNHSISSHQKNKSNKGQLTVKDKIDNLFFNDELITFKSILEKQIPNTIQLWLNRFFISKKDYAPALKIEEIEVDEVEKFELDIVVKDSSNGFENIISYQQLISENQRLSFSVLKDLQIISEFIPALNNFIKSKGSDKIIFSNQEFVGILEQIIPVIKMLGIHLILPKSLQLLSKPKATVQLSSTGNKTYFKLDELVQFNWQISMGGIFISPEDFLKIYNSSTQLIKIKEQYVMLKKEDVEKILEQIKEPFQKNPIDLVHAAISEDYEGAPITIDAKLKKELEKLFGEKNVSLPKKLNAKLRPYQERGYSWLYKNAKLGLGSILADDMGLGKTLQTITALLKFKDDGFLKNSPALIIAPTSLLSNWQSEIQKFAPTLNATIFHGNKRDRSFSKSDIVITTYGISRTDNALLSKQKWYTIVIDEAQNIKNTATAQTKAVKNIPSSTKIALSGTPVENRLSEYWSIFDYCNKGYLGSADWFNREYGLPIEANNDKQKLEKFKKITAPFILRRLKSDKKIISDLPDKIESNQYTSLTKEQAALYNSLTNDLLVMVDASEGMTRKGLILKLLTILKQVCNHPNQYTKAPNANPQHSGKIMLLLQLLENIYEAGEKVIIFSQYKEMGDILNSIISEVYNKKPIQLHGGTTRKERDEMVKSFQNNAFYDTFILSLKAGGTGLNLTAANHVIHFDLWWNPALEAQATDRAFRIGQKKNVFVHRLITKGTLEEKIDKMLNSKKELSQLTVNNGEKWIGDLSNKDLKELVSL